jgi:hypothetical protein
MKFIASFILTALLSFVACFYFPWWCIAIAAFIVAVVIPVKPFFSFLIGFLSLFFLWVILASYISADNENLLAHRISPIILKTDSPFLLILLTGLIGGLVAGFAALAGSYLRKAKPDNTLD